MKHSLLILFLALVLGACVPQAVRPQPPAVELLGFSLIALDPFSGKADFDVRLRLTNPNSYTLPLLDSTVTAELGGTQFRFTVPAVELPNNTPREVRTRLTVPVVEGTKALATLVSGASTRFRLLGELRVQLGPAVVPVGPVTLVDRDIQLQLAFQHPHRQFGAGRAGTTGGLRGTKPQPYRLYLGRAAARTGGRAQRGRDRL